MMRIGRPALIGSISGQGWTSLVGSSTSTMTLPDRSMLHLAYRTKLTRKPDFLCSLTSSTGITSSFVRSCIASSHRRVNAAGFSVQLPRIGTGRKHGFGPQLFHCCLAQPVDVCAPLRAGEEERKVVQTPLSRFIGTS